MSKAILVIDMPETCEDCQLRNFNQCYGLPFDRTIIEKWDGEEEFKKRNHICPLKPLPKKIARAFDIDKSFIDGYNYCIDEILGEEE